MVAAALASLAPGQAQFAFAGSALLFPYYLGVLHTLNATGYIVPGVTPLAGLSGGALTSTLACAGVPAQTAYNYLVSALLAHPENFWAVRQSIVLGLGNLSSPGAHQRCSGKVHVAMSQLSKYAHRTGSLNGSTSWVVSNYKSMGAYYGAVVGSSTIACAGWSPQHPENGGPTYVTYRKRAVMDGGYANNMTTLCGALGLPYGGDTRCVSVQTYEPGFFRKPDAAPAALSRGTFTPAPKGTLPTNCSAFANGAGLPSFVDAFDPAGAWPSIVPGCDPRNPLAFTRAEWQGMALDATAAFPNFQLMYQYGKRDGELWVANQTGSVPAPAPAPVASPRRARARAMA